MTRLKTYRIGIYESCAGYITIEAHSEEQARAIACDILENDGIDGFRMTDNVVDYDYEQTDRQVDVVDSWEQSG